MAKKVFVFTASPHEKFSQKSKQNKEKNVMYKLSSNTCEHKKVSLDKKGGGSKCVTKNKKIL